VLQCHSIHYKSHKQSAGSDPKPECVNVLGFTTKLVSIFINSMWPMIQQITQNEHQSTTELDYIAMDNQESSLKWK